MMERLPLLAAVVCAMACAAAAQPATGEDAAAGAGIKVSFRPSVAIVVGIFTMIFSLTFLLLMYAKFCHPQLSAAQPVVEEAAHREEAHQEEAGVAKAVIESLPFFRFAALRGGRRGLECAVCLARFDDADLLRLLPRCRHAFHLDCVDRWLESSASCPLCRQRVDGDGDGDELGLKYPASARFVFGGSDRFDDPASEQSNGRDLLGGIFVERAPSSRFAGEQDRHEHRIVVSDALLMTRWSDLNSAALVALDTELSSEPDAAEEPADMTNGKKRLLEGNGGRGRGGGLGGCSSSDAVEAAVRSVSEIVSLPRIRAAVRTEEERRWLPIARRTARWFVRGAVESHDVSSHV